MVNIICILMTPCITNNSVPCTSHRCGEGLLNLVQTNEVQSFLHGTPMQSLNRNKHIYQPGTLRKVFTFFTQACSILSSYSLQ